VLKVGIVTLLELKPLAVIIIPLSVVFPLVVTVSNDPPPTPASANKVHVVPVSSNICPVLVLKNILPA